MAKLFDCITPELQDFIHNQHLFFVATAPIDLKGHINLSPKGLDTFQILSPTQVAYLDLTGSGNETSAHLEENGRITFMFCAFQGAPKILRLYGSGRTVLPTHSNWPTLSQYFSDMPGVRQIIVADIERIQTSCGYAVPYYQHQGPRDTLIQWAEKKGQDGLQAYWRDKGRISIDGLPTSFGHALNSQSREKS